MTMNSITFHFAEERDLSPAQRIFRKFVDSLEGEWFRKPGSHRLHMKLEDNLVLQMDNCGLLALRKDDLLVAEEFFYTSNERLLLDKVWNDYVSKNLDSLGL